MTEHMMGWISEGNWRKMHDIPVGVPAPR
jgi:hypothetical protein